MTAERILELGDGYYHNPRQLADGTWICLAQFLFTWAVMIGLDETGYHHRFCFTNRADAELALAGIISMDDEPKGFVARK